MKCVNQSKPDCPRIQQIIEDDDIKNHLITAFIGADCKSVQLPENIINLTEQKSKEKRKVNIMSLPKKDLGDNRKTDLMSVMPIVSFKSCKGQRSQRTPFGVLLLTRPMMPFLRPIRPVPDRSQLTRWWSWGPHTRSRPLHAAIHILIHKDNQSPYQGMFCVFLVT